MKIVKQDMNFNAFFLAYKEQIIEEVIRRVTATLRRALSDNESTVQPQKRHTRGRKVSLKRVVSSEGGIPCPVGCGATKATYNEIGFHLRRCTKGKGRGYVYKQALSFLNKECSCGTKATRLASKEPWPDGSMNHHGTVILNHVAKYGIQQSKKVFFGECPPCQRERIIGIARSTRKVA